MKRVLALLVALMLFCSNLSVFAQGSDNTAETEEATQPVTTQNEQQVEALDSAENVLAETSETVLPEFTLQLNNVDWTEKSSNVLQKNELEMDVNATRIYIGKNTLTIGQEVYFKPNESANYAFKTSSQSNVGFQIYHNSYGYLYCNSRNTEVSGTNITSYFVQSQLESNQLYDIKLTGTGSVDLSIGKCVQQSYTPTESGTYLITVRGLSDLSNVASTDLFAKDANGNEVMLQGFSTDTGSPVYKFNFTEEQTYSVSFANYSWYTVSLSIEKETVEHDVNGDGVFDIKDAKLAKQIAMKVVTGTEKQIAAGDLDDNKVITINEARQLKRMALSADDSSGGEAEPD